MSDTRFFCDNPDCRNHVKVPKYQERLRRYEGLHTLVEIDSHILKNKTGDKIRFLCDECYRIIKTTQFYNDFIRS